jgi:hypothetical protein
MRSRIDPRARSGAAAARDHIGAAPLGAHARGDFFELAVHVGVRPAMLHGGAVQVIQQHVAALGVEALVAPCVSTIPASRSRACASRNSSFRVLLPPLDKPVQSSCLMQTSGPPSARVSRGRYSSGVGRWASGMRAKRPRFIRLPRFGCFQCSERRRVPAAAAPPVIKYERHHRNACLVPTVAQITQAAELLAADEG